MGKENLKHKIKYFLPYILGRFKESGLLRQPNDERDFKLGSIWGDLFGSYSPQHIRHEIRTISIKDQKRLNTCGWASSVAQKEVDEKVCLSVKGNVRYGARQGMISGDGYSYLRDNQKVLQDFGSIQEKDLPDTGHDNWETYSKGPLDMVKAEVHKTQSFWSVSNRSEMFKLLDEGKPVQVGMDWYSGFNQSGGFSAPWLITKNIGFKVGGHAVFVIGYDLDYHSFPVYIIQNSYSERWGDNGKFYVAMNHLDNQIFGWGGYGAYANLDIQPDLGKFFNEYDGKNVKSPTESTIYFIQKGKKKPYLHEFDYRIFNVEDEKMTNFSVVDKEILDKVELGDHMDITKSVYWPLLKHLSNPLNLTRVVEATKK